MKLEKCYCGRAAEMRIGLVQCATFACPFHGAGMTPSDWNLVQGWIAIGRTRADRALKTELALDDVAGILTDAKPGAAGSISADPIGEALEIARKALEGGGDVQTLADPSNGRDVAGTGPCPAYEGGRTCVGEPGGPCIYCGRVLGDPAKVRHWTPVFAEELRGQTVKMNFNRTLNALAVVDAAVAFEAWATKNVGATSDWPADFAADNEKTAGELAGLLTALSKACKAYQGGA